MSSLRKFKRGTGSPLIKEVARRNGVSEDEVRTEIEEAIKYGMNSKEPEVMAFWAQFNGRTPTVEEVVKIMVDEIQKNEMMKPVYKSEVNHKKEVPRRALNFFVGYLSSYKNGGVVLLIIIRLAYIITPKKL